MVKRAKIVRFTLFFYAILIPNSRYLVKMITVKGFLSS